jgi:hypothetical protein
MWNEAVAVTTDYLKLSAATAKNHEKKTPETSSKSLRPDSNPASPNFEAEVLPTRLRYSIHT